MPAYRDGSDCTYTTSTGTSHAKEDTQCLPRSPPKSPPDRQEDAAAARPRPRRGEAHAGAARTARTRSVRARAAAASASAGRSRYSCMRRNSASSRRSSAAIAATNGGAAAAVGVRDPGHRQAVARPVRVVRARAAGRACRRHESRRSATCTRDACRSRLPKDERAIYDFIQELYKTRRVSDKTYKRVSCPSRRAGDRRVRRHPRLLRADLDDPQRLPHVPAGRSAAPVRRIGSKSRHGWADRTDMKDRPEGSEQAAPISLL